MSFESEHGHTRNGVQIRLTYYEGDPFYDHLQHLDKLGVNVEKALNPILKQAILDTLTKTVKQRCRNETSE